MTKEAKPLSFPIQFSWKSKRATTIERSGGIFWVHSLLVTGGVRTRGVHRFLSIICPPSLQPPCHASKILVCTTNPAYFNTYSPSRPSHHNRPEKHQNRYFLRTPHPSNRTFPSISGNKAPIRLVRTKYRLFSRYPMLGLCPTIATCPLIIEVAQQLGSLCFLGLRTL
jgi:hypothetical protein